jgi:hypothetical protein
MNIIEESIECDLMDTKNITNCILDYLGIYKLYKAENYYKRREYRIEEYYTIIATSKEDAKDVLIKHLSITDSSSMYNYTKDLNSFYNGMYFYYFNNNLRNSSTVNLVLYNDLLDSITEIQTEPVIYGCKSSFIREYQKDGSNLHDYSFIQDFYKDSIEIYH